MLSLTVFPVLQVQDSSTRPVGSADSTPWCLSPSAIWGTASEVLQRPTGTGTLRGDSAVLCNKIGQVSNQGEGFKSCKKMLSALSFLPLQVRDPSWD